MTQPESSGRTQSTIRQAVSAGIVGSVLEWFDFSLYGSAAALVFSDIFFPGYSETAGIMASFATFAAGFFARPFGGLVFGHLGDRVGRRNVLLATILIMGAATFLIGLLPTYGQIGAAAPGLLVFLRLLQGFGGGAEQSGAVLLVTEYAPAKKRGFYACLPFIGITLGILLAAGVFRLVTELPRDAIVAWGWRVPFLLSAVVVGIGLYIRLRVLETPVFEEVKEAQAKAKIPAKELFRNDSGNFFRAFGARMAENGCSYIFQTFVLTYVATHVGVPEGVGLTGVLIGAGVGIPTLPIFGALSDRVGRRPVYMGAAAFTLVFAFPYFWLLGSGSHALIWIAIAASIAIGIYGMLSPQSSFFPELFEARYRYTGVALARELSAPVAGGIAPFIASALLAVSGGAFWPVAVYIIFLCVITLVSVFLTRETYQRDISEPAATGGPAAPPERA